VLRPLPENGWGASILRLFNTPTFGGGIFLITCHNRFPPLDLIRSWREKFLPASSNLGDAGQRCIAGPEARVG
jgi:hypothetical protein